MAVMTSEQRVAAWAELMPQLPGALSANVSQKSLVRQALDAMDQWISDNQASLVSALPAAARPANGGFTAAQLAFMFQLILVKRYQLGT
jgi:hypothetical protein